MPPVSTQRRPLSYEDPALSDEDVGLIFQVITRAEANPEVKRLPYRALFKAYDEVLAEHEVDADPSYACMRFLLKMGNKNVLGDDLFEKFENLLEQLGIVLELGEQDDETIDTFVDSVPSTDGRVKKRLDRFDVLPPAEESVRATPRRRASFNSMYDVGDDPTQRSLLNRPSSRSSMSRMPVGKSDLLDSSPAPARAPATRGPESTDRTQLIAQFLDVGRRLMSRMELLNPNQQSDEKPLQSGRHARSAVDKDRSERLTEASRLRKSRSTSIGEDHDETAVNSDQDEEDIESSDSSHHDDNFHFQRPEVAPDMLYRPSLSDLLRDASTFNMYRQRAINRRILSQWVKKAIQARQSHWNMELVAVNRDSNTLLRQAFETWHGIIQDKRRAAQTERFFKHLEERAGRARDLYLLTKAFTHWAGVTSEEVAKTSAARRHILGVKYFNAWREITAVNELKTQRFAVQRPFNAWKRKAQQVQQMETAAISMDRRNLKHKVYWQWFWSFCDRRAPQWYDYCLKRRSLLCWLRKFRTNREHYHEIVTTERSALLNSGWQVLVEKFRNITAAGQQAEDLRRHRLLEEACGEWRIQARLAPAAVHVSGIVDRRVLQTAFSQWMQRIQMLQEARLMDERRILRNTWTTWNDLLRCQALTARINERLKIEAMYKWILAERFRLMQRIRDQRIMREVFSRFVNNTRRTYTRLLDRAEYHDEYQTEELLRATLISWRDQMVLHRQQDHVAYEFYAPRLAQESLVAWRSKAQHVQKLDEWAHDARFYFLTTKTVKWWHKAALESAKRRRQEAYAKTRRMIKVHMASKALTAWLSRAQEISDMEEKALQFWRQRSLGIAAELLAHWRGETERQAQECEDADIYYSRQVAYDQLTRWVEVLIEHQRHEQQANDVYRLHSLPRASTQFRRLSLRIFQITSSGETANLLRERNIRKHARGAFRKWLDKARMHLEEARDSPGPLMSPTKTYTGTPGPALFDPWPPTETPFKASDIISEATAPSPSATPMVTPNFLASPSRRAARAKAFAQATTTPATPLYTPFASRLRRAESWTAPRTTSSLRPRTSRLNSIGNSNNVRFVDEEPESPTEGRRSGSRRP